MYVSGKMRLNQYPQTYVARAQQQVRAVETRRRVIVRSPSSLLFVVSDGWQTTDFIDSLDLVDPTDAASDTTTLYALYPAVVNKVGADENE